MPSDRLRRRRMSPRDCFSYVLFTYFDELLSGLRPCILTVHPLACPPATPQRVIVAVIDLLHALDYVYRVWFRKSRMMGYLVIVHAKFGEREACRLICVVAWRTPVRPNARRSCRHCVSQRKSVFDSPPANPSIPKCTLCIELLQ